jgi:hypothetical protein
LRSRPFVTVHWMALAIGCREATDLHQSPYSIPGFDPEQPWLTVRPDSTRLFSGLRCCRSEARSWPDPDRQVSSDDSRQTDPSERKPRRQTSTQSRHQARVPECLVLAEPGAGIAARLNVCACLHWLPRPPAGCCRWAACAAFGRCAAPGTTPTGGAGPSQRRCLECKNDRRDTNR